MAKQLEVHVETSDNDNSKDSAIEIPAEATFSSEPQNSYEFRQGMIARSVIPTRIDGEPYALQVFWLNGIPDMRTEGSLRPSIIHESRNWVQSNNAQRGWS